MGYILPYLIAMASAVGIWIGGAAAWIGVALVLLINVCLDEVVKARPIKSPVLRRLIFHRKTAYAILYFYPVLLTAYLVFGLWNLNHMPLGPEYFGGLLSMCAVMGTMASNCAHELIGKKNIFLRALGVHTLSLINHCVYRISHVEIHHTYMGTDLDPATPRPGDTAFSFMRRCYIGNLQMTFRFEKSRVGLFSYRNRFWHYGLMMLTTALLFGSLIGPAAVVEWFIISALAIQMLMMIDFVEHKNAPRRAQLADGSYEPIRGMNCTDCYHLISNLVYLNVGHHADHHCREQVDFLNLFPDSGADVMRHGYSLMVLRSLAGLEKPPAGAAELALEDGEDLSTKTRKEPVYIETIRRLSLQRS